MRTRSLTRRIVFFVAAAVIAATGSGCAVRPWQREILAHRAMQQPPWPMLQRSIQHMYQVREASQGGQGSAGGGCGCN